MKELTPDLFPELADLAIREAIENPTEPEVPAEYEALRTAWKSAGLANGVRISQGWYSVSVRKRVMSHVRTYGVERLIGSIEAYAASNPFECPQQFSTFFGPQKATFLEFLPKKAKPKPAPSPMPHPIQAAEDLAIDRGSACVICGATTRFLGDATLKFEKVCSYDCLCKKDAIEEGKFTNG